MLKTKNESFNYLLQQQNEWREIEPLLSLLGIDANKVKRTDEPTDYSIEYNNKKIAIEITDIIPNHFANRKVENAVKDIISEIIHSHISDNKSFYQIDIALKNIVYECNHIKDNHLFKQEVLNFIHDGTCEKSKYIDYLTLTMCPKTSEAHRDIYVNFQFEGFLCPLSTECLINAIYKKDKKLPKYKKEGEYDEYWLCLGLPAEERGYSASGVKLPNSFHSDFDRIYITQSLPPKAILLYNKWH